MFGLFLVLIFGFRILMEYFKESQGGFESAFNNILSTGQLLSIPFVLIGLFYIFRPYTPPEIPVKVKKSVVKKKKK